MTKARWINTLGPGVARISEAGFCGPCTGRMESQVNSFRAYWHMKPASYETGNDLEDLAV